MDQQGERPPQQEAGLAPVEFAEEAAPQEPVQPPRIELQREVEQRRRAALVHLHALQRDFAAIAAEITRAQTLLMDPAADVNRDEERPAVTYFQYDDGFLVAVPRQLNEAEGGAVPTEPIHQAEGGAVPTEPIHQAEGGRRRHRNYWARFRPYD